MRRIVSATLAHEDADAANFVLPARMQRLLGREGGEAVRLYRVTFEPGARTHWPPAERRPGAGALAQEGSHEGVGVQARAGGGARESGGARRDRGREDPPEPEGVEGIDDAVAAAAGPG